MCDEVVNDKILDMILSSTYSDEEIITFVRNNCQKNKLKPQTLNMIFKVYMRVRHTEDFIFSELSDAISIDELSDIHHDFANSSSFHLAALDNRHVENKYIIGSDN